MLHPVPWITAGVSQDEFRDMANGFVTEELGRVVDVNAVMRSDTLLCWYDVGKGGISMCCHGTMGPPVMGITHSSVDVGCSGTSALRSGDQHAELLRKILCWAR